MSRYGEDPVYCAPSIAFGTTDAVMSQPTAAGAFGCARVASKCSSQPRKLCVPCGLSSTPMYTSPSGPTVGEAVESSLTQAAAFDFASRSSTEPRAVMVALSSATSRPVGRVAAEFTTTYSVRSSPDSAGALFMAGLTMEPSPHAAATGTLLTLPSAPSPAKPLTTPA